MDIVNHYLARATVFVLGFGPESLNDSKNFRNENGVRTCRLKVPITLDADLVRHCALGLIVCALCVLAWIEPSFAQTLDTIDKAASNIDGWLGGTIAKTVAGIAVAAVGYACLANRLSWFWFFAVILGIAIIFGRKQIVDMFAG